MTEPTIQPQGTPKAEDGSVDQLHDAAITATEAWQADPTEEKKTAAHAAVKATKDAQEAHKKKAGEEKVATEKKEKDAATVKASEEAKNKPPEKYELKLPEGSHLTAADLEKTAAYAREQGLSNEKAQALLERDSKTIAAYVEGTMSKEAVDARSEAWLQETKNDKEIGGAAFDESATLSKKVVTKYGSEELRRLLSDTGLGNHPELVRFLVAMGRQMSPDQLVISGEQETPEKKSAADTLYGGGEKK